VTNPEIFTWIQNQTTIIKKPEVRVAYGTNVTLNCPIGGFPLELIIDIIWKKDGNIVNNSLVNVTIEDGGLYTCTIGSAYAEITLIIDIR